MTRPIMRDLEDRLARERAIRTRDLLQRIERERVRREATSIEAPEASERYRVVAHEVCRRLGADLQTMLDGGQKLPEVRARLACYLLLNQACGLRYGVIARLFGRDKSTVASGIRRAGRMIARDAEMMAVYGDVVDCIIAQKRG